METATRSPRFTLLRMPAESLREAFARDVREGLAARPKRLSCRFFYDAEGSRLFERICELPEYDLTRAEREILEARAPEIVAAADAGHGAEYLLAELGSGSAAKTRLLIEALLHRRTALRYLPVDISPTALEESAAGLLSDYPALEITALAAEYEAGLAHLRALPGPKLLLWLGSNIGNLHRGEAARFLARLRPALGDAGRLLVGFDLRKERERLLRAYDDAAGVTAAFNRNLLRRINRELGGRFDPEAFRHRVRYDERLGRIEMHLESVRRQRVPIDALGWEASFEPGETIHTENAYKYAPAEIERLARAAGLRIEREWEHPDGGYRLCLFASAPEC